MLVKLSGDKIINSEHIEYITPWLGVGTKWAVYLTSGMNWQLTQPQFDELMDCLPNPVESVKKLQAQVQSKGS